MNYEARLGDKGRQTDIKKSLSDFQRKAEAGKNTQEDKSADCRQPQTNRTIIVRIAVAVIMKKFCSYRKKDKKEDKKKGDSFKIDILTHMHKPNSTNTSNLIKQKVIS